MITLFTCGLWLPVWILMTVIDWCQGPRTTVMHTYPPKSSDTPTPANLHRWQEIRQRIVRELGVPERVLYMQSGDHIPPELRHDVTRFAVAELNEWQKFIELRHSTRRATFTCDCGCGEVFG